MTTKSSPSGFQPIGATVPKCPFLVLTDGSEANHEVTDNEDGTFTCSCGETFEWTSQTDYVRRPVA
jgi:hypothetical protein